MKAQDLTGLRFGRLTVVRFAGRSKTGGALWLCKCDCGGESIALGGNLKRGSTKSCGCLHRELFGNLSRTHGATCTRLFSIWCKMRQRCSDPNNPKFPIYGGRGITVCPEWQHFEPFRDWAIANGYADNLTLDRRDNEKGYSPDNCRWATAKEQANNRRICRMVEYNGKTQTIKQWAEETGINYHTLRYRFGNGWTAEMAFTTPVRNGGA